MTQVRTDILIVGAGLSGLTAARNLIDAGRQVLLVEKGRCVGGRLATRRIGPGAADHGAQFFTVRTPEFRTSVDRWLTDDVAYLWAMGWSRGSLTPNTQQGYPRYAARGGMNQLAQHLAQGLDVRLNVQIVSIEAQEDGWHLAAEDGTHYKANHLLLTPPVPQSLALLDAGHTNLDPGDRAALEHIRYAPCLAGMFWFEKGIQIPRPGGVQRPAEPLPWIADNQQKGISDEVLVITVHGSAGYSRRMWDAPALEIIETMKAGLAPYMTEEAELVETQIKRWRYSFPETLHEAHYLMAAGLPPLVFAGDAFGGPRMEGAFLSGLAAAEAILHPLGKSDSAN